MMGDSIKHQALSEELRVDVTVVEELSEPELTLIELWHFLTVIIDNPELTNGGR
jgi:hypothetical protein